MKLSSPEGSPEVQVSYNEQTPGSVKKEDKSIAKVQTTNKETMTDKVGLDELEIPRDTETRHETLRYPPEVSI